jgi:hypothetical protein
MKTLTKILYLFSISILVTYTNNYNLNAMGCPDTETWECHPVNVVSASCSNITDKCSFHYEYCFKKENGILKVFVSNHRWGSCDCEAEIKKLILKNLFKQVPIQEALGVNSAGTYSGVELYTKNCVKFFISTVGPDTYNVVGCEGSTCCKHDLAITYIPSCPPNVPCDTYPVSGITTISTSYIDDNCGTLEYPNVPMNTCTPTCTDWGVTVTFPSGMEKISLNEEDITITDNDETLHQKLKAKDIEEISFINLNGEFLYKSIKIDENEINFILNSLRSGAYFYSYKKDEIYYIGNLLIVK